MPIVFLGACTDGFTNPVSAADGSATVGTPGAATSSERSRLAEISSGVGIFTSVFGTKGAGGNLSPPGSKAVAEEVT
ncbi:hypothetical protein [Adhaeribacter terreus]|uniref:Uncharacterized protein n=1 Tax=Adhaeribacter terreus TaxID=529703 RepID=A0ABW0EFA6_9BACT